MSEDERVERPAAPPRGVRRVRRAASAPHELIRIVYRDPGHICERMTLYASERLAEPAGDWAQRVRADVPQAELRAIADRLEAQSARVAAIQGAVAGTPFYVALVPAYVNYLWEEVRMTLRVAALYGEDPSTLRVAAEVLWLRAAYPNLEAAEAGLRAVRAEPLADRPVQRRPLALWVQSVHRILVFGGFLAPPREPADRDWRLWLRHVMSVVLGAALWAFTWFFPATFMLAMAWGCESHARRLFRTSVTYYSGESRPARSPREVAARSGFRFGSLSVGAVRPRAHVAAAERGHRSAHGR